MKRKVTDARVAPVKGSVHARMLAALGLAAALTAPAASRPMLVPQAEHAPLAAPAPTSAANPALWEIHDGDTLIYLFGTFHTLDDRTVWFDRSVRDAFDQSGELVLETIVPTDPVRLREIGRAADQGMSLSGIEPFSEQLRTFTQIPASPAPALAAPSLAPAPAITVGSLLTAWKAGDTRTFTDMLAGFAARSPAAYRMLISQRNALYGEWIADRLAQPGTVFVAVGSGHLAGKDSVQNWLSAKGIQARRIG